VIDSADHDLEARPNLRLLPDNAGEDFNIDFGQVPTYDVWGGKHDTRAHP
jgi:hypothetical protein